MHEASIPMDKLNLQTPDFTEANISKLAELFPQCVVEAKDEKTGKLRRSIDFDQLRQELSDHVVEGPQERYRLDWPGKREALLAANAPIARTLRPVREESVDFDTTKNLFLEGDNLDALKLLQETFLGKVGIIYIDPPYNTGNDFIYEDDFAEDAGDYLKRSNQRDENGRLISNSESNGRFHSDWVSMMYGRLRLSRNLLRNDGVIFISIDDGESANLRKLCDEVFGEQNFQADISWQKRYTRSNNTEDFTTVVEHIIVYSKSENFVVNLLPRTEEADSRYTNPDNDPRGPWKGASFLNPATPSQRPNLCYDLVNPNTGNIAKPSKNAWRRSKTEFEKLEQDKRLYWGPKGDASVPSIKMFLAEARGLTPINFWTHEYAGNTDEGTRDLSSLFDGKIFDNPKPRLLIRRIIEHACSDNELILDFFAGSSTTADAVMQLNAEDGGNRRFIMVQLPEACDEKSEAFKAGYKTIAEISKERIRRAGKKIKAENATTAGDLDTGFRVLKVDTSNVKDIYYTPDAIKQDELALHVDHIKEDRTAEDLLFQVMLDWGVDLSLPIKVESIAGKQVYFVDHDAIAACFETGLDEDFVKALAQRHPLRAVFRDSSYASDALKINIGEIFKLLSPSTELKTL